MQVQTVLRIRLELAEISEKTQNCHFFGDIFGQQICTTAPKTVFPDQGENWCRQSWRHMETIDICCIAQFVTHHEMLQYPKTVPLHETSTRVVMRTGGIITAMPRSILRVSIWNFRLVFEPHVQRDRVSALLFCLVFRNKFWSLLFFWDR